MPDTILLPDMDALYKRLEKVVDVERQSEIDEFLRTHRTFDGRNPDGTIRYKLRPIPKTPNWNWRGQEILAREIAGETERKEAIGRARTEKTLKRLRTQSLTLESKDLAEKKLSELISEREVQYRGLVRNIFTMSKSELDAVEIDREFFGTALSNSLERAIAQRRRELE